MTGSSEETEVDRTYRGVQAEDADAFAAWLALVEMPLRRSLRPFARSVDAEVIMQEGLLRMWVLAPKLDLHGRNASLRFALRLFRNMAISETRRLRNRLPVDPREVEDHEEMRVEPEPPPDPHLRQIIWGCIEKLPRRAREVLLLRITTPGSDLSDRERAAGLGIKVNTFVQQVVRARRLVSDCLKDNGVPVEEVLR